ncbi:MAG: hypothetical protein ACRDL0_01340 [Thermoleophilaceae bacterium]
MKRAAGGIRELARDRDDCPVRGEQPDARDGGLRHRRAAPGLLAGQLLKDLRRQATRGWVIPTTSEGPGGPGRHSHG